ncbi:peptidase inhibitor family I36 protein [Nonomuraea sp. NPDC049152]|uniref:peptidase inhibitor family I36 protein n=1 Tax=Nonomuraea sp. NPDC049152 TaxID=3154350 RepID=UPI0033E9AB84
MSKRSLWGAVVAVSLAALLPGSPADAASWDDCAPDRFCLYTGEGGEGAGTAFAPENPAHSYVDAWDDTVSSVWNNTEHWACVYRDAFYGGMIQAIRPGFRGDLTVTDTKLNDQISSHKLAKSKAGCWTGYERCQEGYLCLFTEVSGRGKMTATTVDLARYNADWNDKAVSVANRTTRHACFYHSPDYLGTWGGYRAYVILRADSTVVPQPFAQTFSSHKLVADTRDCRPMKDPL